MRLLHEELAYLNAEQLRMVAQQFEIFFAGTNWHVEVFDDPHEGPAIYFVAEVTNTYQPTEMVELRILSYLSPNDRLSIEHFKRYVLYRLKRIAIHEVGEGLKFAGQLVWDPHEPLEPGGKEQVA